MKLETHIKNCRKRCGLDGRDIHDWLDAHFDHDKFSKFVQTGILPKNWNPYSHREQRHCIEALDDCLAKFKSKYTNEEIECIFKSHLKDDYRGYLPNRSDFSKQKFHDKYHKF